MPGIISSKGIKKTIEEIKESKINMAYISNTQTLIRYISPDPQSYYLADGPNSRLMLDNMAIVLSKGFIYKQQFNEL